jgi:hypothetical protein
MAERDDDAAPVGEEIHFPAPSYVPAIMAVGVTLFLVGLTLTPILSVVGGLIFLWTLVRWIRDVRRDVDELPAEH